MRARRPSSYQIIQARRADIDRIMEIERLSFPNPWSRQVFVEEFDRDFARLKVMRDEETGEVLGFINYWLVHDEVHVLNIATHPDWRRKGLARRLLTHVLRSAQTRGASLLTLEVRRSNSAAISLYQSLGFVAVGVRARYYENAEDAIIMERDLRRREEDDEEP